MCGICGIFDFRGAPVDKDRLGKMTSILSHRGPDGTGSYISEGIGLGHRRLSIIDLEGGAQPISNENNSLQVVFNGEIYNFVELREELKAHGHKFKTRSDTEVIIHGYEQWGVDCLNHFNGIFAFALWDKRKKQLLIARDHLGIKPLYYTVIEENKFLFASEIKSLLTYTGCTKEVDITALEQLFTFRFVPSPNTLFKDIKKVPPGHCMIITSNGMELKRYWKKIPKEVTGINEADLIESYQALVEDAVRLQLRSDVPVGLFLSSGVDSSSILSIMRKNTEKPIYTFTIGFEGGEQTNETDDARAIAQKFGADHTELILTPADYEKYYERYLWDIEEPVGNESAAAFYFVSKLASEKVKVVLTGQGADEPWAGYHRYIGVKLSQIYSKLPPFVTQNLLKKIISVLPRNERLKRGSNSLSERDILTRFTNIYSFYSNEMKSGLFQDWVKSDLRSSGAEAKDAIERLQSDVKNLAPLTQMLYIDTRASLPDDLLMVGDKTSMANSIEARVPFLDYRLIEFVETLPSNLKLKGLQGKYLHKKAAEKWLPKKMVYIKKKGFANPVDKWMRGKMKSYIDECLLGENTAVRKYFNADYIKRLTTLHNEGKEDYMRHIYLLVTFELWHNRFIDN